MTSKADKLPLETEPVARDNNTILTLKRGGQTLSRLTQLIIVVSLERKEIFPNSKEHFFLIQATCLCFKMASIGTMRFSS